MGVTNSKTRICEENPTEPSNNMSNTSSRRFAYLNQERTEPFHLIWLDECAKDESLQSLRTQALFREINHENCLFFNQSDPFFVQINELQKKNAKVILVISGSLVKKLLQQLRSIESIPIIIIFCADSDRYRNLLGDCTKIVKICTTYEELRSSIRNETLSSKFNLFENRLIKCIRPLNSKNGIENYSAYHSYILFIKLLKQMPQTRQAKENMLKTCRDYYRGNEKEPKKIDRFQNTYQADQAIDWYKEDCFVYRLVNHAFRTEDVALWYTFRYYVADLCQQLEKVHKEQNIQTPLTLYRGQSRMSTSEIEYCKCNIGCLVSTNGFLSTSTVQETAQSFMGGAIDTDDLKAVLFEITVDESNLHSTIFVNIDQYTKKTDENEVLFNIGSVFCIDDVFYNETLNVWMIKMKATNEGTEEIKKNLHEKKRKFRQEKINLIFGSLLIEMNEYSKAESYFQMLLKELPKSHKDIPLIYDYIGNLNMRSSNWNEAFRYFKLALEIKKKTFPSNHSLIAVTLNDIGNYYKAIADYSQALQYYTKALKCNNDRSNIARIYVNIAVIHANNQDYDKAIDLCLEARTILQQMYPRPYENIIYVQCTLGHVYTQKKEYQMAEDYYVTALELSEKVLSIGHRLRVDCIKALADLYKEREMKHMAIDFCQDKLLLYKKSLPAHHISIAYILLQLGELYESDDIRKIASLRRAIRIFERSFHLEYVPTANCLLMIGEYYKKHNGYDDASKYFSLALEIQKKIYPNDHSIIVQTRCLINAGSSQT